MASKFELERTKAKMDALRRDPAHAQKAAEARKLAKAEYLRQRRQRRAKKKPR
jgi:hypothetical protein